MRYITNLLKNHRRYLFKPYFNIGVSMCCCHGNSIRITQCVIRRRSSVQEYVYTYPYWCSGSSHCWPQLTISFAVLKAQGNLVNTDSGNALVPVRRQTIAWTNIQLPIGPLWTKFRENWIEVPKYSLKKMHLKVWAVKCQLWYWCFKMSRNIIGGFEFKRYPKTNVLDSRFVVSYWVIIVVPVDFINK